MTRDKAELFTFSMREKLCFCVDFSIKLCNVHNEYAVFSGRKAIAFHNEI